MYTDGKTVHYGYDEQIRLSELKEGGRIISYGYDALGRLSEIQKDGQIQTAYGYDAFGNRTWKEESGEQTSYQYNALNQMVSERQGEIRKEYGYDKRGNLTAILENGAWKKQYVYGAMNRLEEAVDAAGKQARYQYNGLGHRVGKQEGVLPKEKLEKLDPQRRVGMEIGNSRQITYTLDLTRQYYNLLERTEESQSQRYFWDGNVAAYEENGRRNYYLQDDLGSPLRLEDSFGTIKENYEYGVFGKDLYQNQGKIQPFGYTGYQRDNVAGTYYAQAREYQAEVGRFAGRDIVKGYFIVPMSLNEYSYCINNSLLCQDNNGMWITIAVGAAIGCIGGIVSQVVTDIVTGEKPSLKKYVTSAVSGAIGGAVGGATGNMAAAGAASAASSTLIEGIWDIADGTTEFTADNVTKLALDTVGSAVFGAGIGYVTGKMGEKIVKSSSTLKNWEFKYKYADRRIKQGTFTLLKTLEINGKKFFALEAISAFPDFVTNTFLLLNQG